MLDPDTKPHHRHQLQLIALLVIVLVGLLAGVALGYLPGFGQSAGSFGAAQSDRTDPKAMLARLKGIFAARPTAGPTLTMVPTKALSTATPQGIATATPPPREDHYWLSRPIAATDNDAVARFYPYGSRNDGTYPIHHGVEMVNTLGTPIMAAAPGVIVVADRDWQRVYGARPGFYGNVVIEELDRRYNEQPVYVVYAHVSEMLVSAGQRVETGDVIARVGSEGSAEAPHLHMEVRVGANDYGTTVNPELWLVPRPGYGTLAGRLVDASGQPISETRIVIYQPGNVNATYREIITYPDTQVNSDPGWGENFASGDLLAGEYLVETFVRGRNIERSVTVVAGATAWLEIRLSD